MELLAYYIYKVSGIGPRIIMIIGRFSVNVGVAIPVG